MTASIPVNISPGELIDKITILEIKLDHICDEKKITNIKLELASLTQAYDEFIHISESLRTLSRHLKSVNKTLWNIEDDIRECERHSDFSDTFVQLARSVYVTNDERARLKREINILLGSHLVEEKSYTAY
ncbi:MAG: hypothetical protein CBB68_03945 [Rhodospirillaceae bacterium TMED8]|nr:hypothetical protein [Magnetovibrio sp.]OUT52026.1 MAG: hypothetical protein CBB68_03945 [Rhodospirillaceae bacterium TMED8]